jgi:hypothetical protein
VTRRVYFYFLLTLLLGIIVGGAGMYHYAWHSGHWHNDYDPKQSVKRMSRDLTLDDSQVQKVTVILEDYARKRKDLEQKNAPEFDALRQQTRDRIRQILNADQLAKFNEHVRKTDERLRRQHSN